MTHEVYSPWRPRPDIPPILFLVSLGDDEDALRVTLVAEESPDRQLLLLFRAPIAYRVMDESYRLRTWQEAGLSRRTTLLTVLNSHFTAWLVAESCGVLDDQPLVHYAVFTDNECLDIVSQFPPEVVWREAGTEAMPR
jgi:hypothetical protein